MNPKQLMALVKLRYQLTTNQIKQGGKLNIVFAYIFYGVVAIAACSSFFIAAIGGAFWFRDLTSFDVIMTWNIIAGVFLAMWILGMVGELQQTELISLDRLLHLPVSLQGGFFLNYLSTFFNGTFLVFAPLMLGMSVGMVLAQGWKMAIAFPLMVTFLFFVTSFTFQFRGWVGGLMENKRNKGTIAAIMAILVIVLTQIPTMVLSFDDDDANEKLAQRISGEIEQEVASFETSAENDPKLEEKKELLLAELESETSPEYQERRARIKSEIKAEGRKKFEGTLKLVDTYFPPGWLPLGITNAFNGKGWLVGILGSLAMLAMGMASMVMSYRSTMQRYTGASKKRNLAEAKKGKVASLEFLHRKLPFCSNEVSAVAVSSMRSLFRAPETKMMLIMPALGACFGIAYFVNGDPKSIPKSFWTTIPIAAITMTMFTVVSTVFNQFGMDRDGFRAFVLSPLKRRDILLGKNLAFIPLAMGVALALVILVQFLFPINTLSFLAGILQIPCNFLLYCIAGNTASIFFPMGIKRGTMQPSNPRFVPMFIMILATFILPGILLMPTMLALGVSTLINHYFGWSLGGAYLILSAIQLALSVAAYWWMLNFQGKALWNREQKILDIVANVPE